MPRDGLICVWVRHIGPVSTCCCIVPSPPNTPTVRSPDEKVKRCPSSRICKRITFGTFRQDAVAVRVHTEAVRVLLVSAAAGAQHGACASSARPQERCDLLRELASRRQDNDRRLGDARALRRATAVPHLYDGLDAREQVRSRLPRAGLHQTGAFRPRSCALIGLRHPTCATMRGATA